MRNIAVIGSGFSGLSCAASLAQKGHQVTIFEKNKTLGGRARQFTEKGFKFDMGPSWYWMPDVFERFYRRFNKNVYDYFKVEKLDPGFQIIFENKEELKIPANWDKILVLFETIEEGSSIQLEKL